MVSPIQIQGYLQDNLDCEHVEVEGDGAHFQAVIVSNAFEGKSRVARHQIVYGALGDRMREEIHALSMQTLTLAEWQAAPNAAT
ncbi:MAG: BolA family protein [Pseudomonadota bacterium]